MSMTAQPAEPPIAEALSLYDGWQMIARHYKLIFGIATVVAMITAIWVLLLPNRYQSQTTLMPLGETQDGFQSLLGNLGGLPLGIGNPESPSERILAVVESRTLAESVITRLELLPHLFSKDWHAESQQWQTEEPPTLQDGVRALKGLIVIRADQKKGLITVAAEHTDPVLAARIANTYIGGLQQTLHESAFSLATKNRRFIEGQLQQTRQNLARSEEALQRFEKQHGIVALEAQASAAIEAIATLQEQIITKEVQLRVIQRSVTGASREVALLQEELEGLRAQMAQLEAGKPSAPDSAPSETKAFLAFHEASQIKLQYFRLEREVRIQNELFRLLTQQLEQAKIEEARDETAFQVVDTAIPPEKKSGPRRLLSVLLASIVGTLFGCGVTVVREAQGVIISHRDQVERQLGLPVLVEVPSTEPRQHRHRQSQPLVPEGIEWPLPVETPAIEALRYLQTRLQRWSGLQHPAAVLITSATPQEESAQLLATLALVAASMGEKVLLIDSNLRQPVLHHLLAVSPVPGLLDVLREAPNWHKGTQAEIVSNLHFLPAGTDLTGPATTLASSAFDAFMANSKETYDLILCAAPPVLEASDAAVLSGKVDATCLVLASGTSRLDRVSEAKARLEAVQANRIGIILTHE